MSWRIPLRGPRDEYLPARSLGFEDLRECVGTGNQNALQGACSDLLALADSARAGSRRRARDVWEEADEADGTVQVSAEAFLHDEIAGFIDW